MEHGFVPESVRSPFVKRGARTEVQQILFVALRMQCLVLSVCTTGCNTKKLVIFPLAVYLRVLCDLAVDRDILHVSGFNLGIAEGSVPVRRHAVLPGMY